jgi:hypothetical protein
VNVRSYVIVAAIIAAASILPAAANAAGSRAPVYASGANDAQIRVHTTGLSGDKSVALTLQERLNRVKANKAKLTKQLRTVKASMAKTGGNLRATRALAAKLRGEIAANQRMIDLLWGEIYRLRSLLPPEPPPPPITPYEKCMSDMNDCTPELLCSIYGMNCDQVPQTPSAPPPVDETPVETPETPIANDTGGSENTDSSQEAVPAQGPAALDQDINYDEC